MKTKKIVQMLVLSTLITSCIPQMEKADGSTNSIIQTSANKGKNSTVTEALNCKISNLTDPIQTVVDFEKCDQMGMSIFSNYKISNYPVVLTGIGGDFNSVTVVQKGNIVGSFKLSNPLKIQNGLYEYHNPSILYQNLNPGLVDPLAAIGIKKL